MRRQGLSALPSSLLIYLLSLPLAFAADTLKIETTTPVSCSRPTKDGDTIAVHYRGTLESNGAEFDASYSRGKPITFKLGAGQVIKGWDQGLLDMCPGEARKLTIPSNLAYGAWGSPPVIPGGATLIFETELVDIVGVKQEELTFLATSTSTSAAMTSTATEETFSIATAPSTPPPTEDDKEETADTDPHTELEATPLSAPDDKDPFIPPETGRCHLLGPFALLVQAALGAAALLALVYKRWRETPKRPWKIFFFDVSKQILGSCLTHVINLLMSMLGAGDLVDRAAKQAAAKGYSNGDGKTMPNPCSFYLLNLAIDTTLGIPVLYLLLKVLHVAFRYTPLARPVESIKTGHYGNPPHATWWMKQSLIYFIGLTGMKMFVLFLFAILPWLPWVGDWALRWTEGNEALQIAFAMFIFPLAMNAVQYWVIDNFIMEKQGRGAGKGSGEGYQRVLAEEDDDEDAQPFIVGEEDDTGKAAEDDEGVVRNLKEVDPTPVSAYGGSSAEGSRKPSPRKND